MKGYLTSKHTRTDGQVWLEIFEGGGAALCGVYGDRGLRQRVSPYYG